MDQFKENELYERLQSFQKDVFYYLTVNVLCS